jgi:hypothetical protein
MRNFLLIIVVSTSLINSQNLNYVEGLPRNIDKCGFSESDENYYESVNNWGYSYDSLLVDLNKWKLNQYIKIDSIGLSVQGRPLWQLTISENPNNIQNKRTVYIHARTHPQETEGFWVTREILNLITAETNLGRTVRSRCVFYIIPMFNPDGVQLNRPRNNANNIDLESNWFTIPNQPEVAALKARFTQLMNSPNPIEVELNMHSSSLCKRYFVYHDSAGTSPQFAIMQQNYINGIRNYFPGGIEPWNYYISWTSGNPLKYPESWFWLYHGQNVMAMTYEDMYQCSGTGKFDSTANALVRGVLDYLNIPVSSDHKEINLAVFELFQNYPNPFNSQTIIRYSIPTPPLSSPYIKGKIEVGFVTLKVYDILGKEVATLVDEFREPGIHEIDFNAVETLRGVFLPSGVYFYQLKVGNYIATKKMIFIR